MRVPALGRAPGSRLQTLRDRSNRHDVCTPDDGRQAGAGVFYGALLASLYDR